MPALRSSPQRSFNEQLKRLKNHPSLIVSHSLAVIKKYQLQILPFCRMTKTDVEAISEQKIQPNSLSAFKKSLKAIYEGYVGSIYKKKIFISENLTDKKFTKTLVHEINHYLNKDKEDSTDTFVDELRAHLAETYCESTPLLRSKVKSLAHKVVQRYDVPLPKKLTLPDGTYYLAEKTISRRNHKQ